MAHGIDALRGQLVQAVRDHDQEALERLYAQVRTFGQSRPDQHARLPERLRHHSAAQTSSRDIKKEWEEHVDACRAAGKPPGPALWPMWSRQNPADTASSVSASRTPRAEDTEWKELQRKYLKRKKQVVHFEKWYTEFEDVNRAVVEQLNGVYRRLHAEKKPDAEPVDTAQWLPLDDVADALVRLVPPPAQPEAGTETG